MYKQVKVIILNLQECLGGLFVLSGILLFMSLCSCPVMTHP